MQARRRKLEETLLSTELLVAGDGIDSPRASWLRGKHRRPQQDCDERRLGHPGTAILLRHRVTNTAVAVSRQQLRRILTRRAAGGARPRRTHHTLTSQPVSAKLSTGEMPRLSAVRNHPLSGDGNVAGSSSRA